ncbi:MAG: DUF547 domain-containing protein [Planctomycetota bacterium]
MKRLEILIPWILLLTACAERKLEFKSSSDQPPDLKVLTKPLDELLQEHVESGRVDYPALERSPEPLHEYLASLQEIDPADLPTSDARLAFWINTYNAAILSRVLEGLDASSLISRGRLFKSDAVSVGGQALTPDEIEHQILRKQFEEPLIHFGLVCASKSCPPLRSEAYHADRVREQLADNLRAFLADESKNRLDAESHALYLSEIFDWFEDDFLAALERKGIPEDDRSVVRFLRPYAPSAWGDALDDPDLEVEHQDYDWSLNGPAPKSHD